MKTPMKHFGWEQAKAFTCMIRSKNSSNHSTKFLSGQIPRSVQMHENNIWIISNGLLYKYNFLRGTVESYDGNMASICISASGVVWAATNNGILKKYNRAGNNFESYDLSIFSKDGEVNGVRDIYPLEDSVILVGTFAHAYAFNTKHPGLQIFLRKTRN
jgi:ligand-binding sensor domain-containing protein